MMQIVQEWGVNVKREFHYIFDSKFQYPADWCHLPYEFLSKISNRIINNVKGINRVTYDISSKPPATIEWE